MSAEIIDGKAIAEEVRREVAADVAAWVAAGNEPPGLATVLVGEDPASAVYVGGKQKATHEVGMLGFDHRLAADAPQAEVEALLAELNGDPRVSGILLQLPTPGHIDGGALTWLIDPGKDVDGLTPVSAGLLAKGRPGLRPCTPAGCMELLDRYGVELEGAEAVVVGRSDLVGKPIAQMLLARNATVTMCHSRTRDLPGVCRRADVLVAAVGRARMVQGDWVKPGATVIDVGINRTEDGLVGDVDFEAVAEHAARITPVPRGVGPMTIAMLLRNTLAAARARGSAGLMRRVRDGEWIAGAGGVALLAALFAGWYSGASAWQAFSVLDVVLALLALVPLALVVLQATRESPSLPVAFSLLTTVAGALATLLILYRILNQPGPNDRVEVELGAWIGLAAAVVTTAGGWRSLRVEAIPGVRLPPVEDLPAPAP